MAFAPTNKLRGVMLKLESPNLWDSIKMIFGENEKCNSMLRIQWIKLCYLEPNLLFSKVKMLKKI